MDLKGIQKDVDEWTGQFTPQYWPIFEQYARLGEETGEVGRVLNHLYGSKKRKEGEAQQSLGQELIDVIFTIVCMANSKGINLQKEWDEMMKYKLNIRDAERFERKPD